MQGGSGEDRGVGLTVGLKTTGQPNLVLPRYFAHHSYSSLSAGQLRWQSIPFFSATPGGPT